MPLDYPYAVLPGIEPAKASAAKVLFEVLTTPSFRNRLAAQSLRAPDGNWGEGFKAPQGAPSPAGGGADRPGRPAAPRRAAWTRPPSQRAVSSWSIATQSGRMLCRHRRLRLDEGAGAHRQQRHPGAGHRGRGPPRPRASSTTPGRSACGPSPPSWSAPGTTGSSSRSGRSPASGRQLEQGARRHQAVAAATPASTTPCWPRTRTVQEDWEPGRVNSIVLFTDGKNEDDNGISTSSSCSASSSRSPTRSGRSRSSSSVSARTSARPSWSRSPR